MAFDIIIPYKTWYTSNVNVNYVGRQRKLRVNWHNYCEEKIFNKLDSNKKGLSNCEVRKRQEKYGKNILPKGKEPTLLGIFISQFKSPLVIILLIATVVSVAIGEFKDAIFIAIALLINAVLGTYQENSAVKSAASINKLLVIKAKVLRDGQVVELDSEELVPGDIVLFESGDKVPADVRLIEASNLQIDEAFLTGESVGVVKTPDVIKADAGVPDRFNMLYASSTVQSGRGTGIVVGTGTNTEIGFIADTLAETKESKSPLTIRMEKFTKQIMYIVFVAAIFTALLMVVREYPGRDIFVLVVALSVSAIPASLPIAQTVVLSIGTSKMARRNVLVKKLASVESLGSCTVIASDKTGTLTVNQQTAKVITLPGGTDVKVSGQGYNDEGKIDPQGLNKYKAEHILHLAKMGVLNNEGFLDKKDGEFVYHGDGVDVAFLALGLKKDLNDDKLHQDYQIFGRIPYESEQKYSAVFFENKKKQYATVKGSAETVLAMCKTQTTDQGTTPLKQQQLLKEVERLSAAGYRVIALASGEYQGKEQETYNCDDLKDLTFIGLVSFIDPIRSTSKAAIEKCHGAGIRVLMITGDHPLTAKAISEELNLVDADGRAITGDEVEIAYNSSKEELIKLVTENNVFARVSPVQKAIIVETLKDQGEFIAVTGDGINDAPALKKANIGVAMGSGTDVAKDVSEMIITDDNFTSIVSAVEAGRHAYGNVRKVVLLLIATAFAEVILFMVAVAFGLPLVFTAVQILWISLVTNGIQDIALAFEKGEDNVMKMKPRDTEERIFDMLMTKQILVSGLTMFVMVFAAWYWINTNNLMPVEEGRNFILLVMILLQNVHAYNCRSEHLSAFKIPLRHNPFITYAVIGALILHLTFMYVPFLQPILQTMPVTWEQFGIAVLMCIPLLITMEVFKILNRSSYKKTKEVPAS